MFHVIIGLANTPYSRFFIDLSTYITSAGHLTSSYRPLIRGLSSTRLTYALFPRYNRRSPSLCDRRRRGSPKTRARSVFAERREKTYFFIFLLRPARFPDCPLSPTENIPGAVATPNRISPTGTDLDLRHARLRILYFVCVHRLLIGLHVYIAVYDRVVVNQILAGFFFRSVLFILFYGYVRPTMPVIGRDKLKRPAAVRGLCRAHLAPKTQRRSNPCTLCDPRPSIFTPLPGPSRFDTRRYV